MNYTHTHELNKIFKKHINTTPLEQCFSPFLFSRKALLGTLPSLSLFPLFPLFTHTFFLLSLEWSSEWGPFLIIYDAWMAIFAFRLAFCAS